MTINSRLITMGTRSTVDQTVLDAFWSLSETNTVDRIKSIQKIIDTMKKEPADQRKETVSYCLKRVLRGLQSSRKFARRGFSVLLSELLTTQLDIDIKEVIAAAEESLEKPAEGDSANTIGWVLAFSSLVASGTLKSKEDKDYVYQNLVKIGLTKSYVEISICELIRNCISDGKINAIEFAQAVLPLLLKESPTGRQTLFTLFFYVLLRKETPVQQRIEFLQESYFEKLAPLIRASTEHLPHVHPTIKLLIEKALESEEFTTFWQKVVEDPLYGQNQSEKILLAFQLFAYALPLAKSGQIHTLISQPFMRNFIQILRQKTHPLNKQATELCVAIAKSASAHTNDSDYQMAILDSLTSSPGSLLFDDLTQSKLLQGILLELNETSLRIWIKKLKRIFYHTDEIDEKDALRISAIRQLTACVKNANLKNESIQLKILRFSLVNGFFKLENVNSQIEYCEKLVSTPITDNLRDVIRSTFWKALEAICKTNQKTTRERHQREKLVLQNLKGYAKALLEADVPTMASDVKRWQQNIKEDEYNTNDEELDLGFSIINGVLYLLMLIEPEPASAALAELHDCYKRVTKQKKKRLESDQPQFADVIVDMAISIFSKGVPHEVNNLLISGCSCFAEHVTKESASVLSDVLLTTALEDEPDEMSDEEEESNDDSSEEDDDEDEDTTEANGFDGKVNEAELKFRNDLLLALGPAAAAVGDEGEPLDDDKMLQIDEAVAEVFRQKFNIAREQKENKNALIDLKIRCCDLAQAFLNSETSVAFVLRLLPSLIALSRNNCVAKSNEISLGKKAMKLLIHITKLKLKSNSKSEEFEEDWPENVIEQSFTNIHKFSMASYQKLLAQIIAWTVNNTNTEFCVAKFREELNSFFVKRTNHIAKDTFTPLLEINESLTLELLKVIVEKIQDENVRLFYRISGLWLLVHGFKYLHSRQYSSKEYSALQSDVEKMLHKLLQSEELSAMKPAYLSGLLISLNALPDKTIDEGVKKRLQTITKPIKKKMDKVGVAALRKLIK